MRRTLPAFLAAAGLLVPTAVLAPAAAAAPATDAAEQQSADATPDEQWRSYWVDAFNEGIYSPEEVSQLVEDAERVNANALIVQTARRYDCFCNRALYPRTDAAIDEAPYDPLDEIIEQAHAAGLEVHAWVNVNTLWNSAEPPESPEHVYHQHGPDAEGTDRWLNRQVDGTETQGDSTYIDPGHPDAVEYITEAIGSIVTEYDVDGINLDYVRYPDHNSEQGVSEWGYNEVSLARFQQATGRTDVPEPDDAAWSDWRRDQVTGLVRKVYLALWDIDPTVRLSMDAVTYGHGPSAVGGWENSQPYTETLQDWAGWLDEGIMDTAVTMNYKRDWEPDQRDMFSEWSEFLADHQGERQAVNGPGLYLNSLEESVAQAVEAVTPTAAGNTAAGWSGYAYATPSMDVSGAPAEERAAERDALADALTTGEDAPFAEEATVPVMPWKSTPDEGHVTGELRLSDGTAMDGATVTLQPLTTGGDPVTRAADGSGWFGFAHVDPGHYLLVVDLPNGVVGAPVTAVQVGAGGIAEADTGPFIQLPVRP